jgi:hypothetical protein
VRPGLKDAFQGHRDLPRADAGVDFGGQAFAGELIDDGQHPQRAPFTYSVVHEVQRPLLIGPCQLRQRDAPMDEPPPRFAPQHQARLPIEPIDALVIDRVAGDAQLYPQAPVAVARMTLREFFQQLAQAGRIGQTAHLVPRAGAIDRHESACPPLTD